MLIAEIGNNAFGDFEKAKELIRVSKECGADLVKGQAFLAEDITSGSMSKEFYKQCEFTFSQHSELIEYAKSIKIDLFYSIFSSEFLKLKSAMHYFKISASQFKNDEYYQSDLTENTFISCPIFTWHKPIKDSTPLHVTGYLDEDAELSRIAIMRGYFDRYNVGYSDHTIGIENCIRARKEYNACVIEKHFCLEKNINIEGKVFRDTVHGSDPKEFEQLAKSLK